MNLKPAYEPIVLARKPLAGTVAQNVQQFGTGALNVDGCRIPGGDSIAPITGKGTLGGTSEGWDRPWKNDPQMVAAREARAKEAIEKANVMGRWPANLLLDADSAALLDQSAETEQPSRYFYTAKSSRSEREAGLEQFAPKTPGQMTDRQDGAAGTAHPRAGAGRENGGPGGRRNDHPT